MARPVLIAFAVLLAALLSQFPAFRDAYMQRIGGALDEVTRQVSALDDRAAAAALDRYAYVRRLTGNPDPVVAREGEALVDLLSRQQRLTAAREAIRAAPVHLQAIEILFRLEPDIAQAALAEFQPAIPLSLSAAFHAFVGFLIGLFLPMGVRRLFPRRVVEQ